MSSVVCQRSRSPRLRPSCRRTGHPRRPTPAETVDLPPRAVEPPSRRRSSSLSLTMLRPQLLRHVLYLPLTIKRSARRRLSTSRDKDVERGLTLDLPVTVYTNNKETKN